MLESVDFGVSVSVIGVFTLVFAAHGAATLLAGDAGVDSRVERERGLPLLGRGPMLAVYRALVPLARALCTIGVSANGVTILSVVIAALAATAFAWGHFGIGAAIACAAALADVVDGIVARESRTCSAVGRILDTTADRYVDALLLGGIAVHFRANVGLLVLVLAAIVGSFMVSYASSIERELGADSPSSLVPMRRAHRLAYLIGGATLSPIAARALAVDADSALGLAPLIAAVACIAILGNMSTLRRLAAIARHAPPVVPGSEPRVGARGASEQRLHGELRH